MAHTGFWKNRLIDGISAASEATFPKNTIGAPDWTSTNMVERTLDYLNELPPAQRRLVSLLFIFVELAAMLLVFGFRRFSKIPARQRTRIIRHWRASAWLPFRLLGDALKATTTMMYMSHPSVIEYIEEYRVCARPLDPLKIAARDSARAQEPCP